MKSIKLSAALIMLCFTAFGQSISYPKIHSMEDGSTTITAVETTPKHTVVSFRYKSPFKGAWVQLNKSIYLQDAGGEQRYNFLRSEGIVLRPERQYAKADGEEVNFKVYFEKLKAGTKKINVIERARSAAEQTRGNVTFMNYFGVDLTESRSPESTILSVREDAMPSRSVSSAQFAHRITPQVDIATLVAAGQHNAQSLSAQLKVLDNQETINQFAKVSKSYYDALLQSGFSSDAAIKIITSSNFLSGGQSQR